MVCIVLAMEDGKTKNTEGAYQASQSPATRQNSYTLPLLVTLATKLLLYTNDVRMPETPCK